MLIHRLIVPLLLSITLCRSKEKYKKKDLISFREEVRSMFDHAYSSYLKYAYPYDELRSLSCDGFDTWGSFSLTLIDALDTLAVMGNYTEFRRVAEIISTRENFEANINVSVFETNIRVVGGLLSAHLLLKKSKVPLPPGWPCNGPLLRLAEDMAKRLLVAFDTPTGMPYGTVNLKYGVPPGETSITCTAGIGTFLLEFATLSRLTGDPIYEDAAMNAIKALHYYKSKIGLVGNHVDVLTGHWTARDSGIGAGVDSYFEYLAKGTLLLQDPLLAGIFHEHKKAIEKYIRREDWHLWVSMTEGQVTLPVFQSLDAYWPGVLSLFGETDDAMKSLHNYHRVWKQFGFTPEFYNIAQAEAGTNREGYPLRPELIESVMYLYRATKDPYLIRVGVDILRSLQHSAKTTCGYATINDVRDHRKADRMESFFLAETTKYLYLLFDTDNFIHENGQVGEIIQTKWTNCVVNAGGYIFNTEAHPIDPGALSCCRPKESIFIEKSEVLKNINTFKNIKNKSLNLKNNKNTENVDIKSDSSTKEQAETIASENILMGNNSLRYTNDTNDNIENLVEKKNIEVQVLGPDISKIPRNNYHAINNDNDNDSDISNVNNDNNNNNDNNSSNRSHAKGSTDYRNYDIEFILDLLRKRFKNVNMYPINVSMSKAYQLLSCESQRFVQRISIIGEFF